MNNAYVADPPEPNAEYWQNEWTTEQQRWNTFKEICRTQGTDPGLIAVANHTGALSYIGDKLSEARIREAKQANR